MKKTVLTAALVSLGFFSGAAVAENASTQDTSAQNVPKWTEHRLIPIADSHHLNPDVVAFKLLEMGYENFGGHETDQGLWKMTADKDGERLAIWVNPFFGNVVHEEPIS